MACYDTSPYTCSYDSGGAGSLPGGGNPDYSDTSTWESASDNDLAGYSGPVVLDCYDSQVHDDLIQLSSASNTSATVFRWVRSSSSCSIPWAGKVGTGANFVTTTLNTIAALGESYARLSNFYASTSYNGTTNIYTIQTLGSTLKGLQVINLVAYADNTGTGAAYPFYVYWSINPLFYNCISIGAKTRGFYLRYNTSTQKAYVISCTAIDSEVGFNSDNYNVCFNCYAADNATADIDETTWGAASGWNASKDATADLGGTAGDNYKNSLDLSLDADGLPTSTTNLYGEAGAGENWGRNPYDDISGIIDFGDFFKNDAAGDALSKKDIRGTDRPTPDTADVSWAVGAAEYLEPPAGGSSGPMVWIF